MLDSFITKAMQNCFKTSYKKEFNEDFCIKSKKICHFKKKA